MSNFRAELFDICVMVFVATTALAYAFIEAIGVDIGHLSGISDVTASSIQKEVSGVTYGRLLISLAIGVMGVLVYLAIACFAKKYHLLHEDHMLVVTNTSVWVAISFLIYQERYHFLRVSDFEAESFFNTNFWLVFGILNILFFGLLFNAYFEHRVAHQIEKQVKEQ